LDGLYDAIVDGLRTQGLKIKLEASEQRKGDLEFQLSRPPLPTSVLAELCRRKFKALHASLNNPDNRTAPKTGLGQQAT
jgi:hypothetical protein|tara:strand:- start:901 stop:1137 length:237 start_codon:yes stop_codon:yes gene_type:complete